MDEGVYTLQIKCRLPITDLFLRCPPVAPKEPRRSPGALHQPHSAPDRREVAGIIGHRSSAAGGCKLLDEGVYTLQIKCRLIITGDEISIYLVTFFHTMGDILL